MGCEKFKSSDGKVVGFICSSIQDQGKFLMWRWELHKYLGVTWWLRYPKFPIKKYTSYIKRRRKYYNCWGVLKDELFWDIFYWFEMAEKEILLRDDNPLWSWFYFQRWYRKKLKK